MPHDHDYSRTRICGLSEYLGISIGLHGSMESLSNCDMLRCNAIMCLPLCAPRDQKWFDSTLFTAMQREPRDGMLIRG